MPLDRSSVTIVPVSPASSTAESNTTPKSIKRTVSFWIVANGVIRKRNGGCILHEKADVVDRWSFAVDVDESEGIGRCKKGWRGRR